MTVPLVLVAVFSLLLFVAADLAASARKFYDDDPIAREPETQDASKAQPWKNILAFDLVQNLFTTPGDPAMKRAEDVNTIDEVPDSSWFTNRILAHPVSPDEALRGPVTAPGPAPGRMTIDRAKPAGISPGFVLRDSAGVAWFVQFDGPANPEAASGASMVASRIFHALGYWQAENHLATIRPDQLDIGDRAVTETPSGKIRQMNRHDVARVFARAVRRADGAYRMLASRALPGRPIGGFRYYGTRPDDPNDLIPHEHRRVLRALKVFGAWTNLVDMKAGNTLDTLITEDGRTRVRHYLQDVGSTFGTGALGPHDWDEGYEHLYEGDPAWKRLVTFGFYIRPWQRLPYREFPSIGRFEGDRFDPTEWKPRAPTAAFLHARADDNFWAARRVAAFSDDLVRAVVQAAAYSDPAAAAHLAEVLITRRDRIARTYLPAVTPLVDFALDASGVLTFRNAAVDAGVAPAPRGGYRAQWFAFDNATATSTPIASSAATEVRVQAPAGITASTGAFLRADVAAVDAPHAAWHAPVHVYFRRLSDRWKLVGLERLADETGGRSAVRP